MDGVGGGAGAQPKSLAANSAKNVNEQEPPPAKPNPIVTPWEKALNKAMMAVALAGMLILAGNALLADVTIFGKTATLTIAKVLFGLAAAAAAVALYFAGQATFGPGGQKTQGGLIMAAATVAGGLAAYMMYKTFHDPIVGDKAITFTSPVNAGLIKVIGGGAAVALIGAMMIPKKSMPESEAQEKGYPTSYYAPAPQQDYRV